MAIKGAKHGPRPSYTLKPGEHLCLKCDVEVNGKGDCNEKDKRCLLRRCRRTKKMITKFCKGMEEVRA